MARQPIRKLRQHRTRLLACRAWRETSPPPPWPFSPALQRIRAISLWKCWPEVGESKAPHEPTSDLSKKKWCKHHRWTNLHAFLEGIYWNPIPLKRWHSVSSSDAIPFLTHLGKQKINVTIRWTHNDIQIKSALRLPSSFAKLDTKMIQLRFMPDVQTSLWVKLNQKTQLWTRHASEHQWWILG